MIDWAAHPNWYQVTHWWHWLTYGTNSSGLSSLASLTAALAASVAGYFALRTYKTTVHQLAIVTKQYWDTHKTYLEAVRPHLIVRVTSPRPRLIEIPQSISVTVENVGSGRAINIAGTHGVSLTCFSLAAGAESTATIQLSTNHFAGLGSQTFFLRYSSVDGRRFRAETTIQNYVNIMNEEEVDISAGIEPPSFEDTHKTNGAV